MVMRPTNTWTVRANFFFAQLFFDVVGLAVADLTGFPRVVFAMRLQSPFRFFTLSACYC